MVEVRGSRGGQTRWKAGGRSRAVVGGARVEVGGSIGGSRIGGLSKGGSSKRAWST